MMWRDDGAYDLVVTLGYNDAPPEPGREVQFFCTASLREKPTLLVVWLWPVQIY